MERLERQLALGAGNLGDEDLLATAKEQQEVELVVDVGARRRRSARQEDVRLLLGHGRGVDAEPRIELVQDSDGEGAYFGVAFDVVQVERLVATVELGHCRTGVDHGRRAVVEAVPGDQPEQAGLGAPGGQSIRQGPNGVG